MRPEEYLLLGSSVGLGILLVALGLHVLEAKVILFFLGTSVLLGGDLRVDFRGAEVLHIGVRHGVLEGDRELELAVDGLVETVEETLPSLLIGGSHTITTGSLINTGEDGSLELVADLD